MARLRSPIMESLPLIPMGTFSIPSVGELPKLTAKPIPTGFLTLGTRDVTAVLEDAAEHLDELAAFEENWDGEGAAPPHAGAVTRARAVVTWAAEQGFKILDVDADVLGGIAIWLEVGAGKAWIACMNNGNDTLLTGQGDSMVSRSWNEQAKASLRDLAAGDGSDSGR